MSLDQYITLYFMIGFAWLAIIWVPVDRYRTAEQKELLQKNFYVKLFMIILTYALLLPYYGPRDTIIFFIKRSIYRKRRAVIYEVIQSMLDNGELLNNKKTDSEEVNKKEGDL